ncbi:MAG: hypothetical protein QXG00_04300 [Candidatus Woesearchaeota archaeon]
MGEDLNITYESLFDILRREKNREELQELDKDFVKNLIEYIRSKESLIKQSQIYSNDQEKVRIQLKNIKKIIRELFERRQRKIINMAIYKVRTLNSLIETKSLLNEEKSFYDEIIKILTLFNDNIVNQIIIAESPKEIKKRSEDRSEDKDHKIEEKVNDRNITLRFINAVPKFLGKENEIFGPFEEEDIASVPLYIADILISKGRAEILEFKNS